MWIRLLYPRDFTWGLQGGRWGLVELAIEHSIDAERRAVQMIDAVIFDMDGLMFDSECVWKTLWEPALAKFGRTVPEGLPAAACGTTGDATIAAIRMHCGEDIDAEGVFREFYRIAAERFAQGVPKKPGLDELLEYLKAQGIPMAVASSSPVSIIEGDLRAGEVEAYFDHVVSGQFIEHSKPAPDIFLEAARRLGSDPACTLVLEDSFAGVRAGAAGGFVTVMVPDLHQPTPEIRALATRVCESLHEVKALFEASEL